MNQAYSSLLREQGNAFVTPSFEETVDRFDWLDTIENEALYRGLCALTDVDLELLRLVFHMTVERKRKRRNGSSVLNRPSANILKRSEKTVGGLIFLSF